MNVAVGIDINGLNDVDKIRISQIGVWKWMDEVCDAVKAPPRELPASLPSSTRLCKSGKGCLKFGVLHKRKAAPAAPEVSILHGELPGVGCHTQTAPYIARVCPKPFGNGHNLMLFGASASPNA